MLSKALHLPPQTCDYTVHRRVRIPMRDGVELLADHYEPITDNPAGTLLVRCPYGRRAPFSTIYAAVYAARGYHVVFQSVRGTFGSGGEFDPMVNEIEDGADTVEWQRLMDVTSDFIYCRLHGSEELYASGYNKKAIEEWAQRVATWAKGGESRDGDYASDTRAAKRSKRDVYVYFDNDAKVRAPHDAKKLDARVAELLHQDA